MFSDFANILPMKKTTRGGIIKLKKKDEKENSKTKNAKEEEDMALAIKPNEATIIRKEMLHPFLKELHTNKTGKEYWKECAASKEMFSPSDIEKMKKMCNGENNK